MSILRRLFGEPYRPPPSIDVRPTADPETVALPPMGGLAPRDRPVGGPHPEAVRAAAGELGRAAARAALGRDGTHYYVSTGCLHGEHLACRMCCEVCGAPCGCPCHEVISQARQWPNEVRYRFPDEGAA